MDFFRINENSNTEMSSSGDIYGWTGDYRSKMEESMVLDKSLPIEVMEHIPEKRSTTVGK